MSYCFGAHSALPGIYHVSMYWYSVNGEAKNNLSQREWPD